MSELWNADNTYNAGSKYTLWPEGCWPTQYLGSPLICISSIGITHLYTVIEWSEICGAMMVSPLSQPFLYQSQGVWRVHMHKHQNHRAERSALSIRICRVGGVFFYSTIRWTSNYQSLFSTDILKLTFVTMLILLALSAFLVPSLAASASDWQSRSIYQVCEPALHVWFGTYFILWIDRYG